MSRRLVAAAALVLAAAPVVASDSAKHAQPRTAPCSCSCQRDARESRPAQPDKKTDFGETASWPAY